MHHAMLSPMISFSDYKSGEVGININPILQMQKLRCREVTDLVPGPTASK